MEALPWLDALATRVGDLRPDITMSRPEEQTLTLALGVRGVLVHTSGGGAFVTGSIAAGNTIASRIGKRVTHLDASRFALEPSTIERAVDEIVAHLGPELSPG